MSETIRTRNVEQQERHELVAPPRDTCIHCGLEWPCPDRLAADATLADLDKMKWTHDGLYRICPDDPGPDSPLPQAAPATDTNDAKDAT